MAVMQVQQIVHSLIKLDPLFLIAPKVELSEHQVLKAFGEAFERL